MSLNLRIIAAIADNGVIGKRGGIPWHIPDDLKRFQRLTSGKPVIMGRITFDSIYGRLGKPLPNRDNIVLTRNTDFDSSGIFIVHSFEEALDIADDLNDEAYVIGGNEVYKLALESPLTRVMNLTEVHEGFDGDTYFPDFDKDEWNESARTNRIYTNKRGEEISYSFVTYER